MMERTELKQRALFERRDFKITDLGIETYTKDYEIDSTNFWNFDDFKNKNRIYTSKKPRILIMGLLTMFAGLIRASLFFGDVQHSIISGGLITLIGIIMITAYFLLQKKYLLLEMDNDTQLFVLYNRPDQEQFDDFIATFYRKRRECYRDKYFYLDHHQEREQQITRIKWLKSEDIITEKEFSDSIKTIDSFNLSSGIDTIIH